MQNDQVLPGFWRNEIIQKAAVVPAANVEPSRKRRTVSAISRRILLLAVIASFGLATVRSWMSLRAYQSQTQWVDHARKVLSATDDLLRCVREAETGQRGFLLTGQERYLDPYNAAVSALPQYQRALEVLTADDPQQHSKLLALERLIQSKMAELALSIRVRRSNGFPAALAIMRTDQSEQSMDRIRLTLRTLKNQEFQLLDARQHDAEKQAQSSNALTINVGFLLCLASAAAVIYIEFDINQRRRLQDVLLSSNLRLELALQAARCGTFDWDIKRNVNVWSKELLDLYGFLPGEPIHKNENWLGHVHPEDREAGLLALNQSLHTGQFDMEFRIRRRDNGEIRWVYGRGQLVFDESRQPARMIGMHVDITERKRVDEALRLNEERLALAKAAACIGIWDWNILTGEAVCSKEYGQVYGRAHQERVHVKDWLKAVHPDDRARAADEVRQALQQDVPYDTDYRVIWPDGSVHWLAGKGRVFRDKKRRPVRMIGVNYEITERKQASEILASEAQRLQQANEGLEQFAHSVSHDLKEPLRTVSTYTQLLARTWTGKFDKRSDELLRGIVEGAARMERLIAGLLEFAQATESPDVIGEAPVSLENSLSEALRNLEASIAQSDALITNDPLPTLAGVPPQVALVFQNLIGNALKYRKPDEAPRVHIGAERRDGEWVISVRDQGIGFDTQDAKRIFGLFQRLHKNQFEGTGVGLTICQRIVERAGGRIWAEGSPGYGAVFYFSFPAAVNEPTAV